MSELMLGQHQLGTSTIVSRTSLTAPTTDTVKAALYLTTATKNASTTAFTTSDATEVSGTGYTSGGITVTNTTAPTSTNSSATAGVAYWTPSASLVYTTVTLATAFDAVLLYNSTQSNKAISVHTFTSQTIAAGTFTLTMPLNTTAAAILRLQTT